MGAILRRISLRAAEAPVPDNEPRSPFRERLSRQALRLDSWLDNAAFVALRSLRRSSEWVSDFSNRFHVTGWRRLLVELGCEGLNIGVAILFCALILALPAMKESPPCRARSIAGHSMKSWPFLPIGCPSKPRGSGSGGAMAHRSRLSPSSCNGGLYDRRRYFGPGLRECLSRLCRLWTFARCENSRPHYGKRRYCKGLPAPRLYKRES